MSENGEELSSWAGNEGREEGVPAASLSREPDVGLVPEDAVVAPSNGPNSSGLSSESQAGEYAHSAMRMPGDSHMGGMAPPSVLLISLCESGEPSPMDTSSSSPSLEAISTVRAPSVSSSSSDWPGDSVG